MDRNLHGLRGATAVVASVVVLGWCGVGAGAEGDNQLFGITRDPGTIQTQLQLALPALEKGVRLLQGNPDPEQAKLALDALYDSYRYLRAAQESSTQLNNNKRLPDPLVQLRNERVWKVRTHLIKCRASFRPEPDGIAMCSEEATAALRELRIILQVFP